METNLNDLTVAELKIVAEENNIELDANLKKAEIVEAIASALPAEEKEEAPAEAPAPVVEEAPKAEAPKAEEPKAAASSTGEVAVFFKKNVVSAELGKYSYGYHILDKELADKWVLLRGGRYARVATPKEVADHFGK